MKKAAASQIDQVRKLVGGLAPPKHRMIRVDKLRLDTSYQRDFDAARARRLYENLDLDALGAFIVSERANGWLMAVDGQHRMAAVKEHGLGEWEVHCLVYTGMSVEQEAALFTLYNNQKAASAWDKFKAELRAKAPECVDINRIVKAAGFEVSNQTGEGRVTCVSTLRGIYRKDGGPDALRRALEDSRESWGVTTVGVEGDVLAGLAFVHLSYNGALDRPAFVSKLAKVGPAKLLANARAAREFRSASVARLVAATAVQYYNRGRRIGKLDDL